MRRPLPVVLLSLVLAGALVLPAGAAIPNGRYAIGDSVMLGAAAALRNRGIQVNATVSRQFDDAIPIVRSLKRDGRLKRTVIVHLGTNGIAVTAEDCDTLSKVIGAKRRLYLVTIKIPRAYRDAQNTRLAQCANRHANTRLIDWYAYSKDHDGWFYADGYHLRPIGRARYAALLDRKTD
jgi:hypothetical protein